MGYSLSSLLDLSPEEKQERGLEHTPREIHQQPETWKSTYQRALAAAPDLNEFLHSSFAADRPTVYLLGAGTSDYIGRALAQLLRQHWKCDVWAVPSTTLLTEFEDYHHAGKPYLWVSFSRSGQSPEGVAVLERALEQNHNIRHIVITCNEQGTMAKLCRANPDRAFPLILDDATNDRGLAMTSSFTNMIVAGQCLAHRHNIPEYGDILAGMIQGGKAFLPIAAKAAETIAERECSRACFVGTGSLRAVADESALKLVELTAGFVATSSESALGLRHGPMSILDGPALFVAFLSSNPRRRAYEVDLLDEICRKRLAQIRAAVSLNSTVDIRSLVDQPLSLNLGSDLPDDYRAPLDVMFGQLLGLYASLKCGLMPDRPSPGGTISRVVAPIRIH